MTQGMTASDGVRENILCDAQLWTGSFVLQPRNLKRHLKINLKLTKNGFCKEIKSSQTNFIESPCCSKGEGEEMTDRVNILRKTNYH